MLVGHRGGHGLGALRRIMGVQQFMRLVTERLFEELLENLRDCPVHMGFPHWPILVFRIDPFDSGQAHFRRRRAGLTAATDATAGAAHDLDEVILGLAAGHQVAHLAGIGQSVNHRHPGRNPFKEFPCRHAIGELDFRSMDKWMKSYRKPPSKAQTSIRIYRLLKQHLRGGGEVRLATCTVATFVVDKIRRKADFQLKRECVLAEHAALIQDAAAPNVEIKNL